MELQPGVRGEDAGGGGSGRCARATRPRASATFDRARRRRAEREREPRANERTLALDRPPRPVDPSVPTARPPSVHRSSPSARLTSSPHPGGPRSSSSQYSHSGRDQRRGVRSHGRAPRDGRPRWARRPLRAHPPVEGCGAFAVVRFRFGFHPRFGLVFTRARRSTSSTKSRSDRFATK